MDNNKCENNPGGERKCANTVGSFIRDCPIGFIDQGNTCVDADECDDPPFNSDTTCTNTDGSFNCSCNDGFYSDGSFCSHFNECVNEEVHKM